MTLVWPVYVRPSEKAEAKMEMALAMANDWGAAPAVSGLPASMLAYAAPNATVPPNSDVPWENYRP